MKHQRGLFLIFVVSGIALTNVASAVIRKTEDQVKRKAKDALILELTGKDTSKQSDIELYAELIEANQNDDDIAFKGRFQKMLVHFKNSAFTDNALYLAARRALDQKDFANAVRYLGRIEKEFPQSNKVVSAKFLKAHCYKSMNLIDQARAAFTDVRGKFPGSPESFRAATELKVLKIN